MFLLIFTFEYVNAPDIKWNTEAIGWNYKSPLIYMTVSGINFFVLLLCTFMAILKYKKNLLLSTLYLVISIPVLRIMNIILEQIFT